MTKTIMVVDDSSSVRQMMSFTLKNAGYEVVEAEDGQDALEKLCIIAVNAIVTDLNMPNVNGIELIRSIRSQSEHKYIPIVVLTTESHESRKQESREAGATGWITKPFIPEQLIGVIKKIMP
jgi:two-component system chemotaxis response regulator CheY